MSDLSLIQQLAVFALPLIFAVTVHEAAHGWVASKLGDNTAKMMGRITFNPLPHIDIIGTIILPLGMYALSVMSGSPPILFGWAKPVPINTRNLKNFRRDTAFVAIAGPLSNFVMLIIWALFLRLADQMDDSLRWIAEPLVYMGVSGIIINTLLMILNLLPLLPLDGGRVLNSLLPPKAAIIYSKTERWGLLILIALMFSGLLWPVLTPMMKFFQQFAFMIAGIR